MSLRRVALGECSQALGPIEGPGRLSSSATCATHHCENGGTCTEIQDGPVCLCPDHYYGTHCRTTTEQKLCASFPCLNGGTCRETPTRHDFWCQCPEDTSGRFCELKTYQPPPATPRAISTTTSISSPTVSPPPESKVHFVPNAPSTTASASFFIPRFSGTSFLELPTLRHVGKTFQIE
eukprot:maker-scaffold1318_size48593-snap-gene-0.7 protein:Tk08017 transcript:maker-scaffold1318_size48593-snap-gene-0.7-mRNA-1 annotation:"low quality protein: protocadherin fat 1-like"